MFDSTSYLCFMSFPKEILVFIGSEQTWNLERCFSRKIQAVEKKFLKKDWKYCCKNKSKTHFQKFKNIDTTAIPIFWVQFQ